jgi:hypothetical protein
LKLTAAVQNPIRQLDFILSPPTSPSLTRAALARDAVSHANRPPARPPAAREASELSLVSQRHFNGRLFLNDFFSELQLVALDHPTGGR